LNTVILNKIESIERCVNRINDLYEKGSLHDYLYQDAIVLNLQRACQQAIDLAMYICAQQKYGIPKNSREAFELLFRNKVIDQNTYKKMSAIVGFRNIAIHEYQTINLDILKTIIEKELRDFLEFSKQIISFLNTSV
jgi:uncharacterized protein YutE (UPF0331/DUF86 family)